MSSIWERRGPNVRGRGCDNFLENHSWRNKDFPLSTLLMFIGDGGFSCKLCHNETNLKSGSLPVSAAEEEEVVQGKV